MCGADRRPPNLTQAHMHGAILDFNRLWVRPDHARSSVWATAVKQIIQL